MKNNYTKTQLKSQFTRAQTLGWMPFFIEAAKTYTEGFFDVADLLAIASRETNLDPKWLKKAGDGGNGFGLLQADIRSFPDWIKSGEWKDAKSGILMGAKVLMQKWSDFENNIGKSLTVRSTKGKIYRYTAKSAIDATAQKIVISSYNCGRWSQFAYSKNQDIDEYSTGNDYAADVINRASVFRALFLTPDKFSNRVSTAKEAIASSNSAGNPSTDTVEDAPAPAPHPNDEGADAPIIEKEWKEGKRPVEAETVEVEQARPPKDESITDKIDKTYNWISGKLIALPPALGAFALGFYNWLTSQSIYLTVGFFGMSALIGSIYLSWFMFLKNKREQRQHEKAVEEEKTKRAREQFAQEITLAQVHTAADKNLNTVTVVPKPLEESER